MDDLLNALGQDARHIEERMPDMINNETIAEITKRLGEFIATYELTQKGVARLIGVSGAQISQFLAGNHKGDTETLIKKIVGLMDTYARRKRMTQTGFIRTSVARRIYEVIKIVEAACTETEGKIGIIVGDAGHGKSVCLRQYAESNANSVYVELDDTMTSTSLFAAIAAAVKIDPAGSLKSLSDRIKKALRGRLLTFLLDEASGLSVRMLSQLRQILVMQCRCPLILGGNNYLAKTIHQDKTRRGNESLDQFTSRVICMADLDEEAATGDGGGDGLYTPEDIRNLYQFGGLRLSRGAVRMLQRICRTPLAGRLRTCNHIIAFLHGSNKVRARGEIDADAILAAIQRLKLPVKSLLPVSATEIEGPEETQGQEIGAKTA
jgi:DNA transposition AAA+ family ATPase